MHRREFLCGLGASGTIGATGCVGRVVPGWGSTALPDVTVTQVSGPGRNLRFSVETFGGFTRDDPASLRVELTNEVMQAWSFVGRRGLVALRGYHRDHEGDRETVLYLIGETVAQATNFGRFPRYEEFQPAPEAPRGGCWRALREVSSVYEETQFELQGGETIAGARALLGHPQGKECLAMGEYVFESNYLRYGDSERMVDLSFTLELSEP